MTRTRGFFRQTITLPLWLWTIANLVLWTVAIAVVVAAVRAFT